MTPPFMAMTPPQCKRELSAVRPQSHMSAAQSGFELGDILDEILGASQYQVPGALPQPQNNVSVIILL